MERGSLEHPVGEALHIIGGRWRAILVYCLLDGSKRFSDLQRHIPSISRRLLAVELRRLEETGIVLRTVYAEVPARVEYQLTTDGLALRSVMNELYSWGERIADRQKENEDRFTSAPAE